MGVSHAMCNFSPGIPKGHLRMGWKSFVSGPPTWDECIDVQPNSAVSVPNEALFSAAARVQVYVLVKDYAGTVHTFKMPASECQLGKEVAGVERYVLPGANGFTTPVRAYASARILPRPVEIQIMNEAPFDLELSSARLSKNKGLFPIYPPDRIKAGATMRLICYPTLEHDAKGHVPKERSEQEMAQRLKLYITLNFDDEEMRNVNIVLLAALHGNVPGVATTVSEDTAAPATDDADDAVRLHPILSGDASGENTAADVPTIMSAPVPWHGKLQAQYNEPARAFVFVVARTLGVPLPDVPQENGSLGVVPDFGEDEGAPRHQVEVNEAALTQEDAVVPDAPNQCAGRPLTPGNNADEPIAANGEVQPVTVAE
jgi:hypothetical protein